MNSTNWIKEEATKKRVKFFSRKRTVPVEKDELVFYGCRGGVIERLPAE